MFCFEVSQKYYIFASSKSQFNIFILEIMDTKTLNEQVAEVINNKKTTTEQKHISLVKLGLQKYEISLLLNIKPQRAPRPMTAMQLTFGVEIETYNVNRELMVSQAAFNDLPIRYEGYNHHDSNRVFKCVSDGSIEGINPIECVTPVLKGRNGLAALKNACATLNAVGAKVNKSTGLHVHIGAKDLTPAQYCNVFYNYQMLESLIDSFMAESRRANNNGYCMSLRGKYLRTCETREEVYQALGGSRYYKVNPCSWSRHQTIEFRQHQGSTDFEKISNWVAFCAKLVVWSIDNRMTAPISSIDDIPFLNKTEKAFFSRRKKQLA